MTLQRAMHVKDFETPLDKKLMFQNNPASKAEISSVQSFNSTAFWMQISLVKTGSQTQPDYHADIPLYLIKKKFFITIFLTNQLCYSVSVYTNQSP